MADSPSDSQRKSSSAFQNQMEVQTGPTYSVYFSGAFGRVCDVVPHDEFVVCVNGEDWVLTLVEAVFLSPRVFSALKADYTIRLLNITDDQIEGDHMGDLLRLLRGGRVIVTKSSRLSLLRLSRHLGSIDLAQLFLSLRDGEILIHPMARPSVGFDLTVPSRDELFLVDAETLEQVLRSEQLRIESEDWLLDLILELGSEYRVLLNEVQFEFLSPEGLSKFLEHFDYREITDDIWSSLARRLRGEKPTEFPGRHVELALDQRGFSSSIVSGFPPALCVIEGKKIGLLYRGTRDGFAGSTFRSSVTGRSNLLILIETTAGWIFGGYAHCKWPESGWASDSTLKSFLFTLKNPHNIPPRRFVMNSGGQGYVLYPQNPERYMVWMGHGGAITLCAGCNTNSGSSTLGFAPSLQCTFVNDSGRDGKALFTGSEMYTVKEVEVFECLE
jgi:hypothetical protein